MEENNTETKNAKCFKCGYEWETKSKMVCVSCPSCMQKVVLRVVDKIDSEISSRGS